MNTTGSGPVSEETATHYPPPPSRPALLRWLVQVTRPVLAPLLGSTACRVFGLLVGVVMFAVGAYTVAATGLALAAGSTPRVASGGVWSAWVGMPPFGEGELYGWGRQVTNHTSQA